MVWSVKKYKENILPTSGFIDMFKPIFSSKKCVKIHHFLSSTKALKNRGQNLYSQSYIAVTHVISARIFLLPHPLQYVSACCHWPTMWQGWVHCVSTWQGEGDGGTAWSRDWHFAADGSIKDGEQWGTARLFLVSNPYVSNCHQGPTCPALCYDCCVEILVSSIPLCLWW
jgi:hypothetical protein